MQRCVSKRKTSWPRCAVALSAPRYRGTRGAAWGTATRRSTAEAARPGCSGGGLLFSAPLCGCKCTRSESLSCPRSKRDAECAACGRQVLRPRAQAKRKCRAALTFTVLPCNIAAHAYGWVPESFRRFAPIGAGRSIRQWRQISRCRRGSEPCRNAVWAPAQRGTRAQAC